MTSKSELTSDQTEQPSYKYSAVFEQLAFGWAFIFVLIALAYALYSGIVDLYGTAWIGIIEIVLLYEVIIRWRLRFRKIRFYEDRAVIQRRGSQQELEYSDVQTVALGGSAWLGLKVRIYLKSQDRPVIILQNPRNPRSKLDLYSWLTTKIDQTGTQQGR